MTTMIIDLQLATQETDGLPSAEQIEQWATAAVRPQQEGVEMTVRIVDEAESHELNLTYRGKDRRRMYFLFPLSVHQKWNCHCWAI